MLAVRMSRRGKLLLLKPTYKDHWLFPGGVIEAHESPRKACMREVKEETGIDCQPTRLLCIDYVSDRSRQFRIDPVCFLGWNYRSRNSDSATQNRN